MRLLIAILCLFAFVSLANAQWESINYGFGGQVQDVSLDPNRPGRMIFHSDMEGHYLSEDYASSWHFIGHELKHPFSMSSAFDYVDEKRIYTGTVVGLHITNDEGNTWDFVDDIGEVSIDNIYINPYNTNQIFVGPGWREESMKTIERAGVKTSGERVIYISNDRGNSWNAVQYEAKDGCLETFNFHIAKSDPSKVWLSANSGIYISEDGGQSWTLTASPENTSYCLGTGLSPDGKVLYGCFTVDKHKKNAMVFARATDGEDWIDVSKNGFNINNKKMRWWKPHVDPRSSNSLHKVLVGSGQNGVREGLYEGTFTWKKNELEDFTWERVFWYGDGWQYDVGWDDSAPGAFTSYYSPVSWPRQLWSTGIQTWFMGDPSTEGWPQKGWYNKYSTPVDTFNIKTENYPKIITYRHTGAACTFDFDVVAHENYVLQCQADNGFVESWDHGKSWTNDLRPLRPLVVSKSEAADISLLPSGPVVIAHGMHGYGAGGNAGGIFIKKLKTHTPKDKWEFIGGTKKKLAGLSYKTIFKVKVNPHDQNQVYLGQDQVGVLLINDLSTYIKTKSPDCVINITKGTPLEGESVFDIAADAIDPNVIYITVRWNKGGIWKGVKNNENLWSFTELMSAEGDQMNDIYSEQWQGQSRLYVTRSVASDDANKAKGDALLMSVDQGKHWKTILTPKDIFNLKDNKWYGSTNIKNLLSGGLTAYKNHIFINYYSWSRPKTGYGVFHGELLPNGEVKWEDFTEDLEFSIVRRSKVYENNDKTYLYLATQGIGAVRRELNIDREKQLTSNDEN